MQFLTRKVRARLPSKSFRVSASIYPGQIESDKTCSSLGAGNTFVLQDPDHDSAIFGLAFRCRVRGHLI